MQYANNHKIENYIVAKDVIYAMTKQVKSNATTAILKPHTVNKPIWFADYDMGRDGYAYHDMVSADYHLDDGTSWIDWNSGNHYRNDGVDIGHIDQIPYVGWTEAGEWLQYTLDISEAGNYTMRIKSASKESGGMLNIEVNGTIVKDKVQLPTTQASDSWETITIEGIPLTQGKAVIRFHIVKEGSDLLEWGIMM